MITHKQQEANRRGIYAIRKFTGDGNHTTTVLASQCKILELDMESGGVWYRLDASKSPVPMMETDVYVTPAGVVEISFNEQIPGTAFTDFRV